MEITDNNDWILSKEEYDVINRIKDQFRKYINIILKIKRIEDLYLYLTGVGVSVEYDKEMGIKIQSWDEMITDREKTKEFILRTSISVFDEFPHCFTNRIFYPRAFKLVYDKAVHRGIVIEEYERFLNEVLAVKNGDYNYLSLAYVTKLNEQTFEFDNGVHITTNERPEYKMSHFLMDLGEMYLSEYRYDAVKTIIDWHRTNKVSSFAYNLAPEYFRRTNSFDQGIRYFKESLNEFPQKDEKIFEQAIGWMNLWRNLKPYKSRPKKKELFFNQLIRDYALDTRCQSGRIGTCGYSTDLKQPPIGYILPLTLPSLKGFGGVCQKC